MDDNLCIKWRDKTGMVSGTQWGRAGGQGVQGRGSPWWSVSKQTNGIPLLLTADTLQRGRREERRESIWPDNERRMG